MRQIIAAVLIVSILGSTVVGAQTHAQLQERERWDRQTQGVRHNRLGWTIAGAAGGFGLGVYLGFKFFDDAIYADRKIWTTVVISAIAGGVAGFLIGNARKQRRAYESASPSDVRNLRTGSQAGDSRRSSGIDAFSRRTASRMTRSSCVRMPSYVSSSR